MRGPLPKDPKLRQRRNRVTTAAILSAPALAVVPELPKRRPDNKKRWHKWTAECWALVSESPMADQLLAADIPALLRLAILWDEFAREPKVKLAGEIRQQEQRFGLTPLDRRRLQWEVERAESASSRTRRRRRAQKTASGEDPRTALTTPVVVQ